MKFILLINSFIITFLSVCHGQENPLLKIQRSLDDVKDMTTSPGLNSYLINSVTNFTLIDQASKIQLGTVPIDFNRTFLPGQGKVLLIDDTHVILSTGSELLLIDVINNSQDTLLNSVTFPEFIINYCMSPYNKDQLVIATKKYAPDKDGLVHFLTKKNAAYDDTHDCGLLLFDLKTREIKKKTRIDFETTVFESDASKLFSGTFAGDVFEIDSLLAPKKIYHASEFPIHTLLIQDSKFITVGHQAPKYLGTFGEGKLSIYDLPSTKRTTIQLPKEFPRDPSSIRTPANDIKRVFKLANSNGLLVSYGHSRLLKLDLKTLDTTYYTVKPNFADFLCFNKDQSQLLSITSEQMGAFSVGSLAEYDLTRQKFISNFRKSKPQESYTKGITKCYDSVGNYHFLGHTSNDYDSIIVYSSNKINPTILRFDSRTLAINNDTDIAFNTIGRLVIGSLKLNNLVRESYNFKTASYVDSTEDLNPEIFTKIVDVSQKTIPELPYFVTDIEKVSSGFYKIEGYDYVKKDQKAKVTVIDKQGKLIFSTGYFDLDIGGSESTISSSGKYLAFSYSTDKDVTLEVWNFLEVKLIYKQKFNDSRSSKHYRFDTSKDILFYSYFDFDNEANRFYSVDLSHTPYTEQKVNFEPLLLDFIVDLNQDLIASYNGEEIRLHKLSDQTLLWGITPLSSSFKINSISNSFSFGSQEELYTVTTNLDYLYFTTFKPHKQVEVLNGILYRAEKSAINNMAFTFKGKGYFPGDYDIYFNRPDSVLLQSGSTNILYNQIVNGAVKKRNSIRGNKKLSDLLSSGCTLKIINKQDIPDVVREQKLNIHVEVLAGVSTQLKAMDIRINGVPLYGKGKLIFRDPKVKLDTILAIPLGQGANTIQLTAESKNGHVSPTETIRVQYESNQPAIEKIKFIGIGVDLYLQPGHNLKYSVKDIRDLATKLAAKFGANIIIDTLLNEQVTVANIRALKKKLHSTQIDDKVIISFSGHGLLSKEFDYYLATHDVDFKNPEKRGLAYEQLEWLLDSIPARKKILFIDACHSGEVDRADLLAINKTTEETGLKGAEVTYDYQPRLGMKNSFDLMQELFANVSNETGTTVISAASGTQFAYEKSDYKNGVFTFSLLELLTTENQITVSKLRDIISKRVVEITNGQQKPTSRNETVEFDWIIW